MKPLLTILCILFSVTGFAQDAAFIVMEVSGKVTYGKDRKAVIGAKVADNETIVVGPGAHVSLACKNSGCARFADPGKYTLKSTQYCKPVNDAAFAKLCKFAWQNITYQESDWRDNLDNTGAASRGGPCAAMANRNFIDVQYFEGDLKLRWKQMSTGSKLSLNIYKDPNSGPFLQLSVKGNSYPLADLKKKLSEGRVYYWNVSGSSGNCPEMNRLVIMSRSYRDSVVTAFTRAVADNITDKATQQYWTGIMLENNHLFVEAYQHYKEASKLAPGEVLYGREVAAFRTRYGMTN